MEKIYKRIFVCKYEMANVWSKNAVRLFDHFENDDIFLIYQISEGNRPAISKRYVDKLGKLAIVRDVSAMGEEDRWKLIIEDLMQYQSKETYVFFISDNDAYQYCSEHSLPFKSVKSYLNLTQACIAYNKFVNEDKRKSERKEKKEHTENDENKNKEKIKVKKHDSEKEKIGRERNNKPNKQKEYKMIEKNNTVYDNSSKNVDDKQKNETKKKSADKEFDIEKKEAEKENKKDNEVENNKSLETAEEQANEADMLGAMMSELAGSTIKVADINNDEEQKDKTSNKVNKNVSTQAENKKPKKVQENKEDTISYERTLEDIEKDIFSGQVKNESIVRKYTELDNSKAETVLLTFERLKKGINKYLKKEVVETLNDDDYVMFIMAILKSYSFDEFAESWQTLNSFEILLNAREYDYIKEEAEHYNKMCKMFYQDDKW